MNSQKVFCLECKADLSDKKNLKSCKCGSKNFIYGNTLTKTSNGFGCSCRCTEFNKISHFNMNPIYVTTYECCNCKSKIGKEIYYESPYYEGW